MRLSSLRVTPFLLTLLLGVALAGSATAQPTASTPADSPDRAAERAAVRQAALDYVEALYQVDSMRVVRSVHPDLVKYGYYSRDGTYRGTPMNYSELKQLAANWNRNPQRVDPDTARKAVTVFEVLDKTASARITAHWGRDYMHLVKTDDGWKIRQILWQSHPPSE
jgi:hypothetical protein